MRVAHVITRLVNGGADENTVVTCNWSAERGHEVILVHGRDLHEEIRGKVHPSVRLVRVASLQREIAPVDDALALVTLVRVLRQIKPDVVHTHTSKAGLLGRFAARMAGVPIIVHGVHIVPFDNVGRVERMVYLAAERVAARMTHAFINVSEGMRKMCIEAGVGQPAEHHVVHSGFDLARFRQAAPPEDWRDILGIGAGEDKPFVVVMLAAFEARKRHLEFLDVVAQVAAKVPRVRFVLAGDGPMREQVRKEVAARGLDEVVRLPGFRKDAHQLIAMADVCVLASVREGLPRVVMQYLACGKPSIASELPGLQEVLRHDRNGYIVPSADLPAMAELLIRVEGAPELLQRLARGARETDLSTWDAEQLGERTQGIYASLMRGLAARGEA
jgi:glycosyltransferase involved in cell wall biosynthesis